MPDASPKVSAARPTATLRPGRRSYSPDRAGRLERAAPSSLLYGWILPQHAPEVPTAVDDAGNSAAFRLDNDHERRLVEIDEFGKLREIVATMPHKIPAGDVVKSSFEPVL